VVEEEEKCGQQEEQQKKIVIKENISIIAKPLFPLKS
jgi:hypothetical protein